MSGSERLGITDPITALDLDNAVTLRLMHHDNDRKADEMKALAKLIAYEVLSGFSGKSTESEETVTESW